MQPAYLYEANGNFKAKVIETEITFCRKMQIKAKIDAIQNS